MKKRNILFVIVQMKMGGSEHLVLDLVRNLDRSQFTPHVAWFYEKEPLPQFASLNIPLFYVPKIKRFDFSTMRQLSKIVKDKQIDVVNAHHFLSAFYSFYACRLANRIGLIYTEHSLWEIQAISRKWQIIGRILFPFIGASIGISNKVKLGLASIFKLKHNNIHTIPNGVDCQVLQPPEKKESFKIKYGFSPDDIIIGVVANLKKNKNHIFLLKVFHQLQKADNRLKLIFIGQGFAGDPEGSEDQIRHFISEAKLEESVLLLGSRTDVPELLKAFDIFCLTSIQEGLPISLIEAMAAGLPVVGTFVEGIKNVISDQENGFLVELNNEDQLTKALHKLVEDPSLRLKFGKKSREMALQNYALENCVKKYEMLFRQFS